MEHKLKSMVDDHFRGKKIDGLNFFLNPKQSESVFGLSCSQVIPGCANQQLWHKQRVNRQI